MRSWRNVGRSIFERYGLTETLICCAVPLRCGPMPGTVGFPLRGVELRLVDDERNILDAYDPATIGEIAVRGPSGFCGYLGQADATEAAMDGGGWFYTGDLATRDEDGAIRIMGRRSVDLIKTGGYKVGAGEVEAASWRSRASPSAPLSVSWTRTSVSASRRIWSFAPERAGILSTEEFRQQITRFESERRCVSPAFASWYR